LHAGEWENHAILDSFLLDQNRFVPKEAVAAVRNFVRTVITGTPMGGGVVAGTLFSHFVLER
jgi:hypothetical protein